MSSAHISQIPAPGDFLNVDLLGEPYLIVVHAKDGSIRVLSRVCPHRSMDIMPAGFWRMTAMVRRSLRQRPSSLRPYANCFCALIMPGRTFELDGQLKACPEMHQASRILCRDDFSLKTFRCEIWQGFVFVNLDGTASPLADELGEMAATWKHFVWMS